MEDPRSRLALIHAQALGYPEAYEELPWGHPAIKVRKKAFLFCSTLDTEQPSMSLKLPASKERVLEYPGVSATGYGLGKHGWRSFADLGTIPLDELLDYVDESYRAVAPKTLARQLGDARPPPRPAAPVVQTDAMPRVLVVGAGPRRRERAVQALIAAGCPAAGVSLDEAAEQAGGLQPEALLVDLGREGSLAAERLVELTAICPDARVFVAGARAGQGTPKADGVTAEPPGDPAAVRLVVAALGSETPEQT